MGWRTVTRIKKVRAFTNKGWVVLSNFTGGVPWKNIRAISVLTGVSKMGNIYGSEVTSIPYDNALQINTYDNLVNKVELNDVTILNYNSSYSQSGVSGGYTPFTRAGVTSMVGVMRVICPYSQMDNGGNYMSTRRGLRVKFRLHIGGRDFGVFEFRREYRNDNIGTHNLKSLPKLPSLCNVTYDDLNQCYWTGYRTTYMFGINLHGLSHGNITVSELVTHWVYSDSTPNLTGVGVQFKVDFPKLYLYSSSRVSSDRPVITLAYEND